MIAELCKFKFCQTHDLSGIVTQSTKLGTEDVRFDQVLMKRTNQKKGRGKDRLDCGDCNFMWLELVS